MEKKKKWFFGVLTGGAAFVALVVLFFVSSKEFFMGRFSPRAMLSNTDVSAMTVEEAVNSMNRTDGFSIVLDKENKTYTVDISDAVSREFNNAQVEKCQDELSFFDYLFHRDVVLSLKPDSAQVDQERLQMILEESLPQTTSYTADAYFDKDLNLINEVQGDDVNYKNLLTQISEDILAGNELEYALSEFYNQPQIKASDTAIATVEKQIMAYKNMNITFTFGKEEETIDDNIISKYLSYKNGKLKLKKGWIDGYVRKMARKYNTYGKTRKFKTTKDGTVTIHGGIMGWWMNETETVKKIKKLLSKQKSETLEPVYHNTAAQHGKNDIGNTYVEISLKRQRLWFYKKGKKIMSSEFVSGLPTKDRETLKGVHYIFGKQRDRYLGTVAVQGYHTHVNYWMPFNWSGQGLHDAVWRHGRFGGNIYKSNGSHGCVNLPLDMAAKLYKYVSIGTPVVIY
ncbi:MAG: L,D-transpeptidase family protein [Lachnospiraceae bacterium]|nr:L,D-transpeptidase family protein [Lachnospiraceae bacterium]